jgi:hypothetical protein
MEESKHTIINIYRDMLPNCYPVVKIKYSLNMIPFYHLKH